MFHQITKMPQKVLNLDIVTQQTADYVYGHWFSPSLAKVSALNRLNDTATAFTTVDECATKLYKLEIY